MKTIEPPYILIDLGDYDWRFGESSEMRAATERFDSILFGRSPDVAAAIRKFLLKQPDHIDALHHYSSYLGLRKRSIEALAFSQTAASTGLRVFPKQFGHGRVRLRTGCVSNRASLRPLYGLMM